LSSPANRNQGGLALHCAYVTAALVAVALIVTWPLAAQISVSLPGDYGDPVFVTWVMSWVNGTLASGNVAGFWNANIFFPERTTLAFSEHFVAQALMVAPVQLLTGNPILSYNIAFLATFVLTGLGMYLLTQSLTGSDAAGYFAAFIAAFNQYRLVYEVAHLHTLSIHWFPFALYALHRYFETDRRRYLAAATAAIVALSLSSIYYMAYCAPFIMLFAAFDAFRTGRVRTIRVWMELWAAAALVLVLTAPFLLPYIEVQQRLGVQRSIGEIVGFSATLDHYRVALPGFAAALALAVLAIPCIALDRSLRGLTVATVTFLGLAFWLSLGPIPQSGGQPLGWPGLYAVFHNYVPGVSGLRVPARFAMLFFVFLALLAGVGVTLIERRWRFAGRIVAVVALAVFLVQSQPGPFPLNQPLPSPGLVTPPPAYLTPSAKLPAIYEAVDSLRPGAIVAELPFGDSWYDLRYMYFSGIHRRRLLNGYSGLFPPSFLARQKILTRPLLDREASAQALAGATHIVVHRAAWTDDTGARIAAWLEQYGGTAVADSDGAVLFELPVRENFASGRRNLEVDVRAPDERRTIVRQPQ
jgi:hypothetical protein